MVDPTPRDLPDGSGRALTIWTGVRDNVAPGGARIAALRAYLPHAAIVAATLVIGFGTATLATAPSMTHGVDDVTAISAIDARAMGLALNLDADGRASRSAELGRDVGAMKREIARLQRALDQAKANQAALSKSAAAQDDVKALKAEIAGLQKTLETARDASEARIEQLTAKLDQPKPSNDDARLAELRERLERIESRPQPTEPAVKDAGPKDGGPKDAGPKEPAPKEAAAFVPVPQPKPAEPETTGSIAATPSGGVVRNWIVRDVYDGVALLDGRRGLIEVMPGARVPGVGRITSIERRDRQWVVVTDRGVILQRQ